MIEPLAHLGRDEWLLVAIVVVTDGRVLRQQLFELIQILLPLDQRLAQAVKLLLRVSVKRGVHAILSDWVSLVTGRLGAKAGIGKAAPAHHKEYRRIAAPT